MNSLEQFQTPSAAFTLKRLPEVDNDTLRAWDAADELITNMVYSDYADFLKSKHSKQQNDLLVRSEYALVKIPFSEILSLVSGRKIAEDKS